MDTSEVVVFHAVTDDGGGNGAVQPSGNVQPQVDDISEGGLQAAVDRSPHFGAVAVPELERYEHLVGPHQRDHPQGLARLPVEGLYGADQGKRTKRQPASTRARLCRNDTHFSSVFQCSTSATEVGYHFSRGWKASLPRPIP